MKLTALILAVCLLSPVSAYADVTDMSYDTDASSTDTLASLVHREGAKTYALAQQHVDAATDAATDAISMELLLAIAAVESTYSPYSVSRVEGATWDATQRRCVGGKRVTGRWYKRTAIPNTCGNLFCGVTQATARGWKQCLALRDLGTAYTATVTALDYWLGRAGTVPRALQGYGCGNSGMTGSCKRYVRKVQRRLDLIAPGTRL